ncbi:predicted protein [Histoplasma capsulatum G186AR]|uniref:Uncharacterized protein n=1 Tax=Ajellomyces capsulatus (strain G186AR / H82 / ATCC MYA-2454 / RMSCC 2432) TaxID=447093 RepID=C0NVW0_AJECG|nr:uncharacterized protein HCBG_07290 [Histoplasma capsulatum G186AR]EEH04649.1 predicted protein [Histoplasma capsulatum G186AR]
MEVQQSGIPSTPTGSPIYRSCTGGTPLRWWASEADPRSVSGLMTPAKTVYPNLNATTNRLSWAGNFFPGLYPYPTHGVITAVPSASQDLQEGFDFQSQGFGSPLNKYLYIVVGLLVAMLL